ncbi:MAG: hypothetical protein F9K10_03260, partial [Paludibacter sp.]
MNSAMKRIFFRASVWLVIALLLGACTDKSLKVNDLRCCNTINPEGVASPSLSWKIETTKDGVAQVAWEIELASSKELLEKGNADVWKSGKQLSSEQFNIKPEGVNFSEATGYHWRARIWNNSGTMSPWSEPAYFSVGLLSEQSWTAQWITSQAPKNSPLPYFRKVFNLNKEGVRPVKATVYFCGLGAGELYLNGQKVDSTRFLDPAQTNYEQYALYSTFDVTDRLKDGDNCLGVMLGNGWFSQDAAWQGAPFGYGDPMLRLQLVALYSDGSRSVLGSNESWMWKEGPVIKTNIYLGEQYDARREVKDWSVAETRCADWKKASLAQTGIPPRLIPQVMEPIRTK